MRLLPLALLVAALSSAASADQVRTPSDNELKLLDETPIGTGINSPVGDTERTWINGVAYYAADGVLAAGAVNEHRDALRALPAGTPFLIYMHGCSGLDIFSRNSARYYAEAGYAVIMPDSFERRYKPKSCDTDTHRGGMHRGVLGWRQAELDLAINRIRDLRGPDTPIVLHGLSEGAITVATYQSGKPVSARIIEGWGCHARWPEYRGLNAQATEPTLSLVGGKDPWFRVSYLSGDCGAFMQSDRHQSVVFAGDHPLAAEHFLLWNFHVQKRVAAFLNHALASDQ